MSDGGETPSGPAEDIAERRREVDHRTGRHRWRKGLVGTSQEMRQRLSGSGGGRRSDAWFERRWSSRALHRLGEITSHSGAGLIVVAAVLVWLVVGWLKSFPRWWEVTLYATSSSITLVMVFAIQHAAGAPASSHPAQAR